MPRYQIEHVTRFEYNGAVRESVMEVRMHPRDGAGQTCERFALSIEPRTVVSEYVDHFGNFVDSFTLPRPHDSLEIRAEATVDVAPAAGGERRDASWDDVAALKRDREQHMWLAPSTYARTSAALEAFAKEGAPDAALSPAVWLTALRDRLKESLRYEPNGTRADSPIEHCLEQRAGVCQDFAHIFIALARRQGVPCRYVSGYLFHREGDAELSGEDATHAWAEAFVPGAGWTGFDAANAIDVGDRHIRIAVGRDYHDVPPTRGVYRGGATLRHVVQVRVRRVGVPAAVVEEKRAVDGFQCQMQPNARGVVARLVGTLGAADAEALEQKLLKVIGGEPRRVVLDLSGLTMLGSAGIGALLKLKRRVELGGGQFYLAAVPTAIQDILTFSKLKRLFTLSPSVEQAAGGAGE